MATIKIEGQSITLDDAIAKDDQLLRAALQVSFPDAKNAEFKRTESGGTMTVTVNKKPGTKGGLIEDLLAAPDVENPALTMSKKITALHKRKPLSLCKLKSLLPEISAAREAGEEEVHAAYTTRRSLEKANATPGTLPLGF